MTSNNHYYNSTTIINLHEFRVRNDQQEPNDHARCDLCGRRYGELRETGMLKQDCRVAVENKNEEYYCREMNTLVAAIAQWRRSKGFDTQTEFMAGDGKDVMTKLMLAITELSEAAEAVRHNDFDNFKEELADTIIRIFDLCDALQIDIAVAIRDKMIVNEGREHKHGKKL